MADTAARVELDTVLDAWTIDLEPPGPAGTSVLGVVPGAQLLVDVAEPGRIGALISGDTSREPLDNDGLDVLSAIFGGAVRDQLPGRRSGTRARRRTLSPEDRATVRSQLSRIALADDLAATTTDDALAALADAEAASLADRVRDDWNLRFTRATTTTEAALRLVSEYPTIRQRLDAASADRLAALGRDLATRVGDPVAVHLRSLIDDLGRRDSVPYAEAESWPSPSASVGALEFDAGDNSMTSGRIRLDRRLFSPAVLDAAAPAEFSWAAADGDLVVRCRVVRGTYLLRLGAHWVRAYRPESRTVLALAPLEPIQPSGDEHWAGARLHIGAQDPLGLAVDVTDAPEEQPPSVLRRAIEAATLAGSLAARLERAAQARATDAWERCARAWQTAGDPDRQALALAHAERIARVAGDADRCADLERQRGRLSTTWTSGRVGVPPPSEPLVADLL